MREKIQEEYRIPVWINDAGIRKSFKMCRIHVLILTFITYE